MAPKPEALARVKKRAHRPSKKITWRRYCFYGKNKKGKTRLSSSGGAEKTLILDPESGTDLMVQQDPHVIAVPDWKFLVDVWDVLKTGEASPKLLDLGKSNKPFEYLSVDGMTKYSEFALHHSINLSEDRDLTRAPGIVRKQDYGDARKHLIDMMTNFDSLPMHIIYTAQERMIPLTADGSDNAEAEEDADIPEVNYYYVVDMPKGARAFLYSEVDVIGRIYTVPVYHPRTGDRLTQRRLQIGHHEKYDTGYRSDFVLPDVVKGPTIPKLEKLMKEGEL